MPHVYAGTYLPTEPVDRVLVPASQPGVLVENATITSSGNESDAISAGKANAILVTVVISAVTGTSPTLVVNVQDSATSNGSFTTEGSSATLNATGTYQFVVFIKNPWYRLSWTAGGTSPSFAVQAFVKPFYIGPNA